MVVDLTIEHDTQPSIVVISEADLRRINYKSIGDMFLTSMDKR